MDLKEFVAQAIIQITEGIVEAQKATQEHGALINPPIWLGHDTKSEQTINTYNKENRVAQSVSFDIAVGVETGASGGLNGKLNVFSVSIGAEASKNEKGTQTSRIRFTIPVAWPSAVEAVKAPMIEAPVSIPQQSFYDLGSDEDESSHSSSWL